MLPSLIMTKTHTFTVVFVLPDEALEAHLDALFEAGCNDAGFAGPEADGTCNAEFDREADSLVDAVMSAIDALTQAIPGVRIHRVEPGDLVSLSAIASRTGRTVESIRLLRDARRGPGGFPAPLGRMNEQTQVWSWSHVADWFRDALGQDVPRAGDAAFLAALNHALQLSALANELRAHPDSLTAVAQFLPRELQAA